MSDCELSRTSQRIHHESYNSYISLNSYTNELTADCDFKQSAENNWITGVCGNRFLRVVLNPKHECPPCMFLPLPFELPHQSRSYACTVTAHSHHLLHTLHYLPPSSQVICVPSRFGNLTNNFPNCVESSISTPLGNTMTRRSASSQSAKWSGLVHHIRKKL